MPLTRSFKETVANRARRDPAFRAALVEEALQAFVDGDAAEARTLLRDCINGTVGFERLGEAVHIPPKSLMRMVGPKGNPTAENLGAIFGALQRANHVRAKVEVEDCAPKRAGRAKRELEMA